MWQGTAQPLGTEKSASKKAGTLVLHHKELDFGQNHVNLEPQKE